MVYVQPTYWTKCNLTKVRDKNILSRYYSHSTHIIDPLSSHFCWKEICNLFMHSRSSNPYFTVISFISLDFSNSLEFPILRA